MQLTPFSILLRALLDQLQAKDQARIFTQPVDVSEVKRTLLTNLTLSLLPQLFTGLFFCFSGFIDADYTTGSCVTHCHERLRLLNYPCELRLGRSCADFLIGASDWTVGFHRVKQVAVHFNN